MGHLFRSHPRHLEAKGFDESNVFGKRYLPFVPLRVEKIRKSHSGLNARVEDLLGENKIIVKHANDSVIVYVISIS
jgi:hypothetical protein